MKNYHRNDFKKFRGFTLIETIITLAVVSLLIVMPTLYVKNIKEQVVLDNTTRQIKSTINKYLHLSTVKESHIFSCILITIPLSR